MTKGISRTPQHTTPHENQGTANPHESVLMDFKFVARSSREDSRGFAAVGGVVVKFRVVWAIPFACLLSYLAYSLVWGTSPSTPPQTIAVPMYRLNVNGSVFYATPSVPAGCVTPEHQDQRGCTAFFQGRSTPVTIVPYPYGQTPVPQVNFEDDYLKNVVPQEIIGSANPTAISAQAVAARAYAMARRSSPNFDNSTSNQAFIPYRFAALRVEGGDFGHNPLTTPVPNLTNCDTFATGQERYQRNVCQALQNARGVYVTPPDQDEAVLTEFFEDRDGDTLDSAPPHLIGVADPISTQCDAHNAGHGHGMNTNGAMRWARGHECSYANANPAPGNFDGIVNLVGRFSHWFSYRGGYSSM